MFPRGNRGMNVTSGVSIYVKLLNPMIWGCTAKYSFGLRSLGKDPLVRSDVWSFKEGSDDRGFNIWVTDEEIQPFVVDDTVEIEISLLEEKPNTHSYETKHFYYDSKRATGFVGLRNQGATCYMNSMLQTLYFIPSFRRTVYLLPTESEKVSDKASSIGLALQRVFYNLQQIGRAVQQECRDRSRMPSSA
eukprot:TRINITY_DN37919_c0_g1_i1.p1 TRINITY_DN37919_c0_g1~~TRINITY_DN37919_c0_g1_i1.p1  ORF type:complete len:190 (+),score=15.00 TRINITY_DN37919_c0_g1_i1:252-821(+)